MIRLGRSLSHQFHTKRRQAGLFSAILTAFIVEAYKLLQPDSAALSTQVLLQISQQLTSLSVNNGFINSTFTPSAANFSFSFAACVDFPERSRPSITMNAPRVGILGLGFWVWETDLMLRMSSSEGLGPDDGMTVWSRDEVIAEKVVGGRKVQFADRR